MEDLKLYVDESLFSGAADSDVISSVEDEVKAEKIREWLVDGCGFNSSSSIKIKNKQLYLNLVTKYTNLIMELRMDEETMKENLYPLNIKQLTFGNSNPTVSISDNRIKTIADVFHEDFKFNQPNGKKVVSQLNITRCKNLRSLKGCPDEVDYFYNALNNKDLSLDGMPRKINSGLSFLVDNSMYRFSTPGKGTPISHYANAIININRLRDKPRPYIQKCLKIFEDYYNHMDGDCGVAKVLGGVIKELQKDVEKRNVKKL
jgi:hypothetical protein